MKKVLFIFLIIFSSHSFAQQWVAISLGVDRVFYVDIDSITKRDGYTFYWELVNLKEAQKYGKYYYKSYKIYHQADCKLFRVKWLQESLYSQEFGTGNLINELEFSQKLEWIVAPSDSNLAVVLKRVCQ